MTTIDELLKAHPLPFRVVVHEGERRIIRDALGAEVASFDVGCTDSDDALEVFCDALSELARLREEAEYCHGAKESEKGELESRAKTIATLRARNAELEAFAERMRGAQARLADKMTGRAWGGVLCGGECNADNADLFRRGHFNAAIYGPGPLPWDEKGGVK